jgi:hypothetical protein
MECYNPLDLEKKIKDEFNKNFKLIAGNEYFEGDEYIMLDLFLEIVKSNRITQNNIIDNQQIIFQKFDNYFEYDLKYSITLDCSIYSLAKNFHSKYSKYFICSDVGNNIWWQFNNGKWYRIESCILKSLLSEDYLEGYANENEKLNIKISKSSGFDKSIFYEEKSDIHKIINLLKNNTFKNKIIDELKGLFYDPYFKQI